ncbi:hypothetical protein JCM33374_g6556 [Metschnikowia sp. JCM 33374]|nr:hypothetical protein JCM33374_g6556 [Metschnikowia sp. JCM 33374]
MMLFSTFFVTLVASLVAAETHTWYFSTGWVNANPDGNFERPVMTLNGTWPLPILRVKTGDTVNFYLTNGFDDRNTSMHFHGMFQNGSSFMDGAEMVTQCPISPGDTMLYNFTVGHQVGTYWYHSHTTGQYGDGMRGVFVIEEQRSEDYPFVFDEEVVLPIGDWYHSNADTLIPNFMSPQNPSGAEPIPKNLLFNETRNNSWVVEPSKTYLVRIRQCWRFCFAPTTTDVLYITVAQRYDVLITTKNDTSKNYAFMSKLDDTMLDDIPGDLVLNSTNFIVYNESSSLPVEYTVSSLEGFLDDMSLVPSSGEKLLDDSDVLVTLDVTMDNLVDGINYAFFNNVTYTTPKVPILATAISAGELAKNNNIYGNVNAFVLEKGDIVDIVVNNKDTGKHPFHLHGHVFQVIARGRGVDEALAPVSYNPHDHVAFPEYPLVRDTVYVNAQSYIVLRFKADNPGVWLFHCHIEWHLEQGLVATFIEAPTELQKTQKFTEGWKSVCSNSGVFMRGNCAGNVVDFMDLTGANVQQKPLLH